MLKIRQKLQTTRRTAAILTSGIVLVGASLSAGIIAHAASCSSASDCQSQINNLSSQNAQSQNTVSQLASQAQGFQDAVNQLQAQISSLQSQIQANQAEQASLQIQIQQAQAQLDEERSVLANDLKALYVGGQTTPIEMLATSSNISEYVDKQEAYTAVQSKIQDTLQKIAALQKTLQDHKTTVDNLVVSEQTQQNQVAAAEAQQQQMLNYNESQQASYNQQIAANKANISQLYSRLAALNSAGSISVSASGTCGGGYPSSAVSPSGSHWGCKYPQDSSFDNWMMYNRECVSYTAYIVATHYGVSAAGWGNAYQWISAAENRGYRVDQSPEVGAIAIRNRDYGEAGDVGHAMYVTGVSGSTITVNEYNENYDGTFDTRTFSPSIYANRGGLYFIHF